MLYPNHFRTTVLNLAFLNSSEEYISSKFVPKQLLNSFFSVYDAFFINNSTRYYKLFLVQTYLQMLKSTGMLEALTKLDSRVTYNFSDYSYFKTGKISSVKSSNEAYPLMVFGEPLQPSELKDPHLFFECYSPALSDTFIVYEKNKGKQLLEETLLFVDNLSQIVAIPDTELNIRVIKPQGNDFSAKLENLVWEFMVESPVVFDFAKAWDRLESKSANVNTLIEMPSAFDTTKYENIWKTNKNKIYRFCAALIIFYSRLAKLDE